MDLHGVNITDRWHDSAIYYSLIKIRREDYGNLYKNELDSKEQEDQLKAEHEGRTAQTKLQRELRKKELKLQRETQNQDLWLQQLELDAKKQAAELDEKRIKAQKKDPTLHLPYRYLSHLPH